MNKERESIIKAEGLTSCLITLGSSHSPRRSEGGKVVLKPSRDTKRKRIKAKRTKSHLVNWVLLFEKGEVTNESMAALQNLIFEGTHVTIVNQETSGKFLVFSSNVVEDGIMRFAYKGLWNSTYKGKRPQLLPLYDPDQYRDMKGRQFHIAANDAPPEFELGKRNDDGSVQAIGGTDFKIIRSLSEALNFTFKIFPSVDGAWGYPQPDGNITGMIGMAARREVHFAVTGIEIRNTVIDYTTSYTFGYNCIYSRALREKGREFAILAPFSLEIWICIVITTLAIGPILRLQSEITEEFSPQKSKWDLQTYSFNIFRNLVQQVLYSGTLTSFLVVPVYEKPIDSLQDLPRAVENGFTLTVIGDTLLEYVFKILQGKSVHIEPCDNGKVVSLELGEQKFYVGREVFYPASCAFVCPQGAPYQRPFNKVIRRLVDAGIVNRWYEVEKQKFRRSITKRTKTPVPWPSLLITFRS
ncbi:glutamate receptor 1-like [Macrobrachium rosenbergii]|uniref:glutamate receptor 1-like n=1 Tax=Macrobrachium rosenbergii TaxID=79674 RepID=UPI0034D68C4A